MNGHHPKGDAPESVPPMTGMPGVQPATPLGEPPHECLVCAELPASPHGVPLGEPLPSVTTGPTSAWVSVPGEPSTAWAGSLTIGASVTGYGPTADAIRAEVDADDAKDAEIKRLRAENAELTAQLALDMDERDDMAADLDGVRLERAAALAQRDDYMTDLAVKIRERDDARAHRERLNRELATTQAIARMLQGLVAEMLHEVSDHIATPMLAKWRERAGLEQP